MSQRRASTRLRPRKRRLKKVRILISLIYCFSLAPVKQLSKKEQKKLEDAEFERAFAECGIESDKPAVAKPAAEKKVEKAAEAGEKSASQKKKEKKKAKKLEEETKEEVVGEEVAAELTAE